MIFTPELGWLIRGVVLALRGRTVPTAGKPGGQPWIYEPIKHQLILSSDYLELEFMTEYMEALRKLQPTFIQAFPSAIYPLARWLAEHPEPDVTGCIKGVLLFSENVYDYQMELLHKVFTCPVLKHYGHSERVLMAASMPDDERCFFWPQYGRVELVDAQGNSITEPNVLGEIVGTSFNNQVMPFVRYRTGDMAMWSEKPGHPALPGYPVVDRIEGRLQEFLVCWDHRLISICTMGAAHFDVLAGVETIQYEQHVPGYFVLKVVSRKPLEETSLRKIEQAVAEKTQNGCTVEVQQVEHITMTRSGKHMMLQQHLDLSGHLGKRESE